MAPLPRCLKLASVLAIALGVAAMVLFALAYLRTPERMEDVLHRMAKYEQAGRYDAAISLGKDWLAKFPQNGTNDQVFGQIAVLYLKKAENNPQHGDEYVVQAMEYRDKMLPVLSDTSLGWYSMSALRDAALISERAGDLSAKQRCVQYQNALKLLNRLVYLANEKDMELSHRNGPKQDEFGHTPEDAQRFRKEADTIIGLIRSKQQTSECQ